LRLVVVKIHKHTKTMSFSFVFTLIITKPACYKLQKYARIYSQRLGFFKRGHFLS